MALNGTIKEKLEREAKVHPNETRLINNLLNHIVDGKQPYTSLKTMMTQNILFR